VTANATAKYVYGIVPATAQAPSGTGIARRRLRIVDSRRTAAIVSDVPAGELQVGREDLVVHARVLERALEGGVVLPMRFGVVMSDGDAVREQLLEEFQDHLVAQLEELEGKAELHLRAVYDEEALMSEILEAHPAIAARSQAVQAEPADATYFERIDLGRLVADAVERTRELDTADILETLEPLAVAVDVGAPEHERVAAHLSLLVEQELLPAVDEAVDNLGRRHEGRLHFKYTGPLPAYSFVDLPGQA
jgi:Gas vesicle synthesis protein GvpL/GvpF